VPTTDEDRAHEELGRAECLRLLRSAAVGRLAYTRSALPVVRPVSFRLEEGGVVIPSRSGSPLLDAVRGAVVAFEVDSYDAERTGWTVSVVGPSRVVGPCAGTATAAITVQLGMVQGWRTVLP
jgi:uncharacterized protein